jgi:hypothetical protein
MRAIISAVCAISATVSACGYFPDGQSGDRDIPDVDAAVDSHPPGVDAGQSSASCQTDCGADVCSALQQCAPASTVRTIRVYWTVKGQPATTSTCASIGVSKVVLSLAASRPQCCGWDDLRVLPKLPCTDGMTVIENVPDSIDLLGAGVNTAPEVWLDTAPTMKIDLQYTVIEL